MKKKILIFLGLIFMIFIITACKSKKKNKTTTYDGSTPRIKDLNKYDGIGVYNNASNSKTNSEVRMIKVIDDSDTLKIDLKLCGLTNDKQSELSYSGYDPFKDKTILGCKFMKNFLFVLTGNDTLTVSSVEYDETIWQITHSNSLKRQSDSNSLYIISFSTGNVYDITEYFNTVEINSELWQGGSEMVFYGVAGSLSKNGSYYLLREENDDINLIKLASEKFKFMDRYDNLYFYINEGDFPIDNVIHGGFAYMMHGTSGRREDLINYCFDEIHGWDNDKYYGYVGISLTGQLFGNRYDLFYGGSEILPDMGIDILLLENEIDTDRYYYFDKEKITEITDNFTYFDENINPFKPNFSNEKEALWEFASCIMTNTYCGDEISYFLDGDNLCVKSGNYKIVYNESNPLRYKLKVITTTLNSERDALCYCSNQKYTIVSYGAIVVFVTNSCVETTIGLMKEKNPFVLDDFIKGIEWSRYGEIVDNRSEHKKLFINTYNVAIESMSMKTIGDKPVVEFKGSNSNGEYRGYIDENYKLVYESAIKANEAIIIHKLG